MFKNIKIGRKLIISFVIVAVLSSLSGVLSLFLMKSSDTQYSDALVNYGFSQGDIGMLTSSINGITTSTVAMIATDDQAYLQSAAKTITEDFKTAYALLETVRGIIIGAQEEACYKTIVENLPELEKHVQKVVQLAGERRNDEAFTFYTDEVQEHIQAVENACNELMRLNKTAGSALSVQLTRSGQALIWGVSVLIVVVMVFSIVMAVWISRSIARPMAACAQRIVALSEGDITTPAPKVDSKDETGILAGATETLLERLSNMIQEMTGVLGDLAAGNLNVQHTSIYHGDFAPLHTSTVQIIAALNDALGQISQAADQVTDGAGQVSNGAQSLSQGATEQASSVQELAATINEISGQINTSAENARQASQIADHVGNQMMESNQQMQEMIGAMNEISQSSQEIGKIIKAIEDIAFQTNILALNAAVEAARAGAAGKGFAVVADEVRNLASKSAEASKNTAGLIESSIRAVENGTHIAGQTAQTLLTAVEGAKKVTETIDHISHASSEQASAIAQVTQGIDQISSVVQTNSATAEQSAAASEELSGQAQMMKDMLGRFQLRNQGRDLGGSGAGPVGVPAGQDYAWLKGGDKY